MTKQKMKLAIIALAVAFVGMNGCKKCYECTQPHQIYFCHLGGDSVGFSAYGMHQINDSLNYYQSRGYNCIIFLDGEVDLESLCGGNEYNDYLTDPNWTCSRK